MKKKLMFSDMTSHVQNVFDNNEDTFEGYRNLLFDLGTGEEIRDEDGKIVSKVVAEKIARTTMFAILGIDEHSTKRDRKRAMKKHGDEFFAVSEEVIDMKVETGFKENEFFNTFVDMRNVSRGDSVEFWTDEKVYLSVVQIAGDHHDFECRVRVA